MGVYATPEEAAESWVRILDGCEPEDALIEQYDRMYDIYRRLDAAVEGLCPEVPVEYGNQTKRT